MAFCFYHFCISPTWFSWAKLHPGVAQSSWIRQVVIVNGGETPQVPTQTTFRCTRFDPDSFDQRQPFYALSFIPLKVGSLSQSVLLIYRNPKPAPSAIWNTRTNAGVAVVFACTARYFSGARPDQNLPVAFFAWFRRISFPPVGHTNEVWLKKDPKHDNMEVGGSRRKWRRGRLAVVALLSVIIPILLLSRGDEWVDKWTREGGNSLVWMELDGDLVVGVGGV